MRVVYCYRLGVLGGVATQLLNRYPTFSRALDVTILFERDAGVAERFPPGVARVVPTVREQRRAIEDLAPDALVVIDSPSFVEAWVAAGGPGRLFIEVHTTYADLAGKAAPPPAVPVAAFVTVSSYMERLLAEQGLAARAPIHVVPNCLDPSWWERTPALIEDAQPLLWVGKLDAHKRWRLAIDVIERVTRDLGDAVAPRLVGGYTAHTNEIESLTARLCDSPALARARWFPRLEYERMGALYSAAAASGGGLLSTTRNESFGMAIAEALTLGCPVVAPRVGALPELLPDEALFDGDDFDAAVSATERLLTDESFRHSIVDASTERVRGVVHPDNALAAFLEALEA